MDDGLRLCHTRCSAMIGLWAMFGLDNGVFLTMVAVRISVWIFWSWPRQRHGMRRLFGLYAGARRVRFRRSSALAAGPFFRILVVSFWTAMAWCPRSRALIVGLTVPPELAGASDRHSLFSRRFRLEGESWFH